MSSDPTVDEVLNSTIDATEAVDETTYTAPEDAAFDNTDALLTEAAPAPAAAGFQWTTTYTIAAAFGGAALLAVTGYFVFGKKSSNS